MKTYRNKYLKIILLLSLFTSSGLAFSQSPSFVKVENDTIQQPVLGTGDRSIYNNYVVKVYLHNLRRTNGTGGFEFATLIETFNILNNAFSPYGICFTLSGSDFIDDDYFYEYYIDPFYGQTPGAFFSSKVVAQSINIFFANGNRSSSFTNCYGFGIVDDGIWLQQTSQTDPICETELIREMGACLGLYYTAHGAIDQCEFNVSGCPELVNGSNSSSCGDFVSDTPADPCLKGNVDSNCNYTGTSLDANGEAYTPLINNYMAATTCTNCANSFTNQQVERMKYYLDNILFSAGYLVSENISFSHSYFNSTGNHFVTSLNNLEVGSSIIENSTVHYVAQNSITFKDGFHVKSGSHVKAYIDNICPFSPHLRMSNQTKQLRHEAIFVNNLFQIAENNSLQTVKVENSEPEFISKKIEAFPNPFSNLLSLNFLNFEPNCPVKLSISDISGKIIFSENFNLESVKKSLDLQYVKDGIYMISISSGDCFIQNFRIVKVPNK